MYGRWASFWFSNSSKVTRKAADLPGSIYSKSRSIHCVQHCGPCIHPGQSCGTCCLPLMSTANLTTKRGSRWSVCAECVLDTSVPLNRSGSSVLALCFSFLGSRQTAVDPVPTEAGGIPKSQINDSITTLSAKAKKSDCTRSTEGSGKRKTKVSLVL